MHPVRRPNDHWRQQGHWRPLPTHTITVLLGKCPMLGEWDVYIWLLDKPHIEYSNYRIWERYIADMAKLVCPGAILWCVGGESGMPQNLSKQQVQHT